MLSPGTLRLIIDDFHLITSEDVLRLMEELLRFPPQNVRLMLSTPQGAGSIGHNSILYFSVSDIVATHAALVSRGATDERTPSLAAKMPDHELWTGFLRDPDGNLVGLMEEKR